MQTVSPLGHPLHRILGRAVKPGSSKLLKRPNGARKPPPGRPGWASPRLGDAETPSSHLRHQALRRPHAAPTVGPPAERQAAGLVKESSSEPVKGLLRRGALGGEPDPSDTGWGTSLGCPGRRHQGAPAAGPGAEVQPGKARSPRAETRQPRAVQTRGVSAVGSAAVLFPVDVFQRVQNLKVSLLLRSFIPLRISVWLQKVSDTIRSKHFKYFLTYVPFSPK